LRDALDGCGLRADVRFRVELVFEEVVANIVRHGVRPTGETHVEVVLETSPDVITLTFDDDGLAFDPCSAAPASTASAGLTRSAPAATLDAAPDGGFGLMMVRRAVSKMNYRRTADARNHLTVELDASSASP
jgi:anti-sigma regulatory factor (Ser/Thr protein kinase)